MISLRRPCPAVVIAPTINIQILCYFCSRHIKHVGYKSTQGAIARWSRSSAGVRFPGRYPRQTLVWLITLKHCDSQGSVRPYRWFQRLLYSKSKMFPIPVNIFSWYFTVVLFNFVKGKLVFHTLSRSLENKFNKMYLIFRFFNLIIVIFFKISQLHHVTLLG